LRLPGKSRANPALTAPTNRTFTGFIDERN
jgi:hypothetical protein